MKQWIIGALLAWAVALTTATIIAFAVPGSITLTLTTHRGVVKVVQPPTTNWRKRDLALIEDRGTVLRLSLRNDDGAFQWYEVEKRWTACKGGTEKCLHIKEVTFYDGTPNQTSYIIEVPESELGEVLMKARR